MKSKDMLTDFDFYNSSFVELQKKSDYTIGIAGNPNVGKSTIFNYLTGLNQHTGNWPGKTVSSASGFFSFKNTQFLLVDIPGTYSLRTNSEEEEIAKKFICSNIYDLIVVVVDASCLERNLNLVYQILEFTSNIIICVNLLDEARKKGIDINLELLSMELNIPVIGTIAHKKKTLNNLIEKIYYCCNNPLNKINENIDLDSSISNFSDISEIFYKSSELCNKVISLRNVRKHQWHEKLDKLITSKIYGIPILLSFLGFIFFITIYGANYPSKLLKTMFAFFYEKLLYFFILIRIPEWITCAILDGVYSTLTGVISVMLPPMAIFFPIFTILEDSGFLPRIAFNLDRCFSKACSSGKQALTMCMGFGCNAAGVVGCRIIDSPREKLIAIITNNFVPCNGRFPLLITISLILVGGISNGLLRSLLATFYVLGIVLIGIFTTLIISRILSKTILKGSKSTFVLELPPYRRPQFKKVFIHSIFHKTLHLLGRAAIISAPAGLIIWLLSTIQSDGVSLLTYIANFLDPFAKLLGLDGYILLGFILALPANEIVLPIILMGYLQSNLLVNIDNPLDIGNILFSNGWTFLTCINIMIFSLLHFPCSTTLLTIKKETNSWKWTFISFLIPTFCGIFLCMITNFLWIFMNHF